MHNVNANIIPTGWTDMGFSFPFGLLFDTKYTAPFLIQPAWAFLLSCLTHAWGLFLIHFIKQKNLFSISFWITLLATQFVEWVGWNKGNQAPNKTLSHWLVLGLLLSPNCISLFHPKWDQCRQIPHLSLSSSRDPYYIISNAQKASYYLLYKQNMQN